MDATTKHESNNYSEIAKAVAKHLDLDYYLTCQS